MDCHMGMRKEWIGWVGTDIDGGNAEGMDKQIKSKCCVQQMCNISNFPTHKTGKMSTLILLVQRSTSFNNLFY